jgi:phytanoyl-CoA hydroxylase
MEFPSMSTRPVLFFNSPALAKKKVYHTVFPHQDWRSMQGSLDAIVLWLPLIDIDKKLGALEVIPGSHKWGLLSAELEEGFGKVYLTSEQGKLFKPIEVEVGDALFFSSLLIHQSGNNISGQIRWSAHFRYNNLTEPTFISRKFPHAYIYKPIENLITNDFPSEEDINKTFRSNKKT